MFGSAEASRSVSAIGELDVSAAAAVRVSSEQARFPIDNAFDGQRGRGGSCWIAADPGPQEIVIAFDAPRALRSLMVEIEEHRITRTQRLAVSLSRDGEATYDEPRVRTFTFTPYGATFEQETWVFALEGVTHLRLHVVPDEARPLRESAQASITSILLR